MERREFITFVGAAAVWPVVAHAQQPALPVIGFMVGSGDLQARSQQIAAFHAGLKESSYVPGQNVAVEFRSAEGQYDRFPELAADLLQHGVALLVAVSNDGALAAKRATTTTPIIFGTGGDPVALGLVASLNHPGGNITGIYFFTQGLEGKRLGLLHELALRLRQSRRSSIRTIRPPKTNCGMCKRRRLAWAYGSLCCALMQKLISITSSLNLSGNGQARCSSAHLHSSLAGVNSLSC